MKKLSILDPCSNYVEEYINFVIKVIMSDDFNSLQDYKYISSLLNACSQYIAERIIIFNAKHNPSIILEMLISEHIVFSKIPKNKFGYWFRRFVKNLDNYQNERIKSAEFIFFHRIFPLCRLKSNKTTTTTLALTNNRDVLEDNSKLIEG